MGGDRDDTLRRAAANVAGWHDSSVRALLPGGAPRPRRDDRWWWYETPAPNIYFTAISLTPLTLAPDDAAAFLRRHRDAPGGGHVAICDSWDELDLTGPTDLTDLGLERRSRGRWCVRAAAPLADPGPPADLEVVAVRDAATLAAFERVVVAGFDVRFPVAPHGIHAPGILADPSMHAFLGWSGGEAVAVSMAYEAAGMLGVYGVTTVPAARRRGFASALTRAALAIAPDRPAMLQPTPAAWPIYEALGFVEIGTYSLWVRAAGA